MRFEWSDDKNEANIRKHGLSFENASRVFDDPLHRTVFQGYEDNEERWETIGLLDGLVVIIVISTPRWSAGGEVTRIISARRASKRERRGYEEEI
jgi:hypothetical protein